MKYTKKEILTKLIRKYNLTLKGIKTIRGYDKVYKVLIANNCHAGICYTADITFGVMIYDKTWVTKESHGIYWYKCPFQVNTKKEIIECLEYRINKMKQILKTCK